MAATASVMYTFTNRPTDTHPQIPAWICTSKRGLLAPIRFSRGIDHAGLGGSHERLESTDGSTFVINKQQTAVGDKYVYENMLQNGYVLGGEQSGHIIFSKHARTGDGILTSLMVMEAILEKKQSLGTLADEVKIFPQLLKNVRVKDKRTALDNEAVQKAIEQTAEELGSDGRILVRESGTEPVIRVMVEAASDEICEKYVDGVVKIFEQEGLCE